MLVVIRRRRDGASFRSCLVGVVASLMVATGSSLPAQGETARPVALMTRAELEAQAVRLEQGARDGGSEEEAASIRERLREGDFRVGDRIVLVTESVTGLPEELARALNDTLVVRDGRVLRLPNMPDLALQGMLRSELAERLGAHLSAYLRGVSIRVEPTVQALISGPVGRPGYVTLAPDMLVTDALMAGSPSARADLTRTVVKRDGEEIIDRDSLRAAVRAGATLDRIGFRSGDELVVGERKEGFSWMRAIQIVSAVAGLVFIGLRLADR